MHGSWEKVTGHHSPLYKRREETSDSNELNIEWAVTYWLSNGVSRNQLVLGLPAYGRSFKLKNFGEHEIGSAAESAGSPGKVY